MTPNLSVEYSKSPMLTRGREVIRAEVAALTKLEKSLNQQFDQACQTILGCRRQLVVTGMGKSGHIARKIAATFASTGMPSVFIHPGEAGHGDLGMMAPGDVLLILSNSGNTSELRPILAYARNVGIPIIGVASRQKSPVIELADVPLLLPIVREACSSNIAPTTSTTMQLALGDALAIAVMDMRGVSRNNLRALHPAGSIGLALTPVGEFMHGFERLPLVDAEFGMPDVISIITGGCFGMAGVMDPDGKLIGIITDGDLRRHFAMLNSASAHEVMTGAPKTVPLTMSAGDALHFLNENKITAAFVVESPVLGPQRPLGIIHIHDLLRHGLG